MGEPRSRVTKAKREHGASASAKVTKPLLNPKGDKPKAKGAASEVSAGGPDSNDS